MKKTIKWLQGLSAGKRVLLVLGIVVLFSVASNNSKTTNLTTTNTASIGQAQTKSSDSKTANKIVVKTENETQSIPFSSTTVEDSNLPKGTKKVTTTGINGSETLTYQVTFTNGKQTSKKLISTTVTSQPVTQVTSIGTYVSPPPPKQTVSNCDPNYTGACVPNVYPSDVDCAGGSGNGPYYVSGPVYVVGVDRYGLDRDGNGVGCQ